jgi:hypothetical protein
MGNELPERINAIKSISYDVQQIVETIMAEQEIEAKSVTLEMVMDRVESWVEEDFANDNADNIGYQDENGSEVLV